MQCGDPCSASDSIDEITLKKWKNIEEQSKKWTGLDTFESVFATIDWKLGFTCLFMLDNYYIKLCCPSKSAQAKQRKEKQLQNIVSQDESSFNSGTTVIDESFSSLPPKHTHNASIFEIRQNVFGVSRDQIKSTKSNLISSLRAWSSFKRHTILLEDDEI